MGKVTLRSFCGAVGAVDLITAKEEVPVGTPAESGVEEVDDQRMADLVQDLEHPADNEGVDKELESGVGVGHEAEENKLHGR